MPRISLAENYISRAGSASVCESWWTSTELAVVGELKAKEMGVILRVSATDVFNA